MRKANVHDSTGLTSRTITNVEKLLGRREESFEDNHSYLYDVQCCFYSTGMTSEGEVVVTVDEKQNNTQDENVSRM